MMRFAQRCVWICGGWFFFTLFLPPYSLHPLCTYSSLYHLKARISFEGRSYSTDVVHQNAMSRAWISTMNSAGCDQPNGKALAFRLANDKVVLIPSRICTSAETILRQRGSVDVLQACRTKRQSYSNGFVIDSAEHPRKWMPISFGKEIQLEEVTATITWDQPYDNLTTIAPSLLKSGFEYGHDWWASPDRIVSFARRYKRNSAFSYRVQKEQFAFD